LVVGFGDRQLSRSEGRHYEHAPITEAVIELQCELPSDTQNADLLMVCDQIKSDYPKKSDQHEAQVVVDTLVGNTRSTQKLIGYRLLSHDERQIVQIRLNAFAFSRLAPYERWETMRAEAFRLWKVYRAALSPTRITRVGVRYINRVDVPSNNPLEGIDLDQYFETAPRIAAALPQRMTNFFMRLQIPIDGTGASAILTETAVPSPAVGQVSTILDIDTFIQPEHFDEESAWKAADFLRDQKNRFFEACITEKVRELIK
jgi:uncharacterized protein (TIGR04255 family)